MNGCSTFQHEKYKKEKKVNSVNGNCHTTFQHKSRKKKKEVNSVKSMEIVTQIATFLNHVCASLFDAQI